MCEQYHIVPWYNGAEWQRVYNYIYKEDTNKENALNLLQMWKARCPSLPSGIESTFGLLQVHVQDLKSNNEVADDQILRLAYSSAVMRFVNHMLDTETAKGSSLYRAAKYLGVPDWIVDLRHDTAHSNNLPSLELLRNACLIGLQWLQNNYWDKHKESIQDYRSGQRVVCSNDENKIAALMNFCSCLSICIHSKIKKLSDIPDPSMQESVVSDAQDLLGDMIDLSNFKTVSLRSLINLTDSHAKRLLKTKDTTTYVNKALLEEESLFLSLELMEYLSKNDFNAKTKLSRSYVQCFEVLLTFLHSNDLLLEFILALIRMTQSNDHLKKTLLAALWTSEILASLKRSKQFINRANKMNTQSASSNKKKDLKLLYHHWFPNERLDGVILDLRKPVPSKLTNINFIQPIISSYNPYLTYFVKDLLNLVEPKLPKEITWKICKLAKLISAPDKFSVQLSTKIYTADDLKQADTMDIDESSNVSSKTTACESSSQGQCVSVIWKLASTEHIWSACPVGKLPWQCTDYVIE